MWEKYQKNLEEIMVMSQIQKISDNISDRVSITPENEIALQHGLITPDQSENIITKNLRMGNFNKLDHVKVSVAGFLFSHLEALKKSKKLDFDQNLSLLQEEILTDVNIVQNSSVSRSGYLVDGILNPKKRFQILPDRVDKKKLKEEQR